MENKKEWYSPSKINIFNDCPQKFKKIYIEKKPFETSQSLLRGSTVHNLIQHHILEFFENGVEFESISIEEVKNQYELLLLDFIVSNYKEKKYETVTKNEALSLIEDEELEEKKENYYKELFDNLDEKYFVQTVEAINDATPKIIDLMTKKNFYNPKMEVKFFDSSNEFGLLGIFDISGIVEEENKAFIIELKTSSTTVNKIKETHINQALFYKSMFYENLKKNNLENFEIEHFVVYINILKTKISTNIIDITNLNIENFKENIVNTIRIIELNKERNVFPKTFSMSCSYCNFKDECFKDINLNINER